MVGLMANKRTAFWSTLFRPQPVERGVPDPIDDRIDAAVLRLQTVQSDFYTALQELVVATSKKPPGGKQ